MRLYVACHNIELARSAAEILRHAGAVVDCRWLSSEFSPTETYTPKDRAKIAAECVADVLAADGLVLIAGPDKYPGGKFVEAGIALGAGKWVGIVGRRENMLLWHSPIEAFPAVEDLANRLRLSAPELL